MDQPLLTIALSGIVTIIVLLIKELPGWWTAKQTQRNTEVARLNAELSNGIKRFGEVEQQYDTIAAKLRLEQTERRNEYELMSNQLFSARSQINLMQTELDGARMASTGNIANLTKQVAELKDIIAELQARLDQEHTWRLAAEKRVAELEAQIARLLGTKIKKEDDQGDKG